MDSTITAERNKMSEVEIARLYQEANRKALIKRRVERTGLVTVNIVAAFVILLPLFYAVSIAFMPSSELFTTELNLFPSSPTLDNFKEAMRKIPLGRFILNSFIVAGGAPLLAGLYISLAGLFLSLFCFLYTKIIFFICFLYQ